MITARTPCGAVVKSLSFYHYPLMLGGYRNYLSQQQLPTSYSYSSVNYFRLNLKVIPPLFPTLPPMPNKLTCPSPLISTDS
jgi:hypothetical protein